MTLRAIEPVERGEIAQDLIEQACDFSSDPSPLIGYALVAIYEDGMTNTAVRRPTAEAHRIGFAMFEAIVEKALQANFTWRQANEAISDAFGGET